MVLQAITPWAAASSEGGPGAAADQPASLSLSPDPSNATWVQGVPLSFAVGASDGDATIRTDVRNVANVTMATTQGALDCDSPVYSDDFADGDTVWMVGCTTGAGRIEMLDSDGVVRTVYAFTVRPAGGQTGGYGAGYGAGYG